MGWNSQVELEKKQDFVFGGVGDGDGDGGTSFEIAAIWKYETGLQRQL